MFKSIDYKLGANLFLLIATAIAIPLLFIYGFISIGVFAILLLFILLYQINKLYSKLTKNVVFLFNAIENGDYAFKFQENIGSMRERELHRVMNHIKDILAQTKREIVEQERFFSIVIENVSTGIIILNEQNQVQTVNHAAEQLLGLPILTHLNQLQSINSELPLLFKNLEPSKEPKQITVHTERGDFQLSLRADRVKMQRGEIKIIILNNINIELDSKEMESWIKLIRVMTHEIMNSIAPITSLTDTLLFNLKTNTTHSEEKEILTEGLETIHTTAKELLQFVQSYRQFTRIPAPQPVSFDATALINKAILLTKENSLAKAVTFSFDENTPHLITADRSHFLQVVLNLLKNAVEVTAHQEDGKIEITFEDHDSDYDIIHIRNNGLPIPKEVAAQIFIPFFTTKEQGTGIGLSISRYIMRMHGGTITLQSKAEYTLFSLYFPRK